MSDAEKIDQLRAIATDQKTLHAAQAVAAKRLLDFDGEQYPHDGCAITLSVLLQMAGIDVDNVFLAIELDNVLKDRGWATVPIGQHQPGDVGTTCGTKPHHGTDHIYLVLKRVNDDEMVIADNQDTQPHFRRVSGGIKSPTTYFLRAT